MGLWRAAAQGGLLHRRYSILIELLVASLEMSIVQENTLQDATCVARGAAILAPGLEATGLAVRQTEADACIYGLAASVTSATSSTSSTSFGSG